MHIMGIREGNMEPGMRYCRKTLKSEKCVEASAR